MTIDLDSADLSKLRATMHTDMGEMTFRFYPDVAPNHVKNFVELAQKGFYDGLAFHRVIKDFMVQGGCPNTREDVSGHPGTGGPGYTVDAEFNDKPHTRGVLSAARSQDPNSAGSQFFICHGDAGFLDRQYTAYGELVEGDDVLDQIATVETRPGPGGENSTPAARIELSKVTLDVVEDQEDASTDASAGGSGDADGDSA